MKLHILSDVHIEFGKWPKQVDINRIDADLTVLAGDIGIGLEGLQWALTIDRPVIYVMGNHEFYGQRPMEYLWHKAREKVENTHVHLMENDSLLLDDPRNIGEHVRFIGAMLWTDFVLFGGDHQQECMESAAQNITDYNAIYVTRRGHTLTEYGYSTRRQGDRLTPRKTLSLHHESRDFLERELARMPHPLGIVDAWEKTVVVTHHAPSAMSLIHKQAVARLDASYASNLENLVEQADLWIHGHTHVKADYCIGGGRVVSNPRGYIGNDLVAGFDPALVVDV